MSISLVERVGRHRGRMAVVDERGEHTYDELLAASAAVAERLLDGRDDLREARVAFMVAPGFGYVATQWAIWRAGGVAVPLCLTHPAPELEYVLDDTGASIAVADAAHEARLRPLAEARGVRWVPTSEVGRAAPGEGGFTGAATAGVSAENPLPRIAPERRAMILYTSGTTSRPKGVVTTHANLEAQIRCLVEAWEWREDDRVLHVLPLHHTHGIVNVLLCALWAGATCEMLPGFDAQRVWRRFTDGGLTLFMAVPTIYVKLIQAWEAADPEERERRSAACRALRLMVSGSAALPVSTFERWAEIGGHRLLERYGMTEIGMALSNPLRGERRPSTVGQPLPTVEVRLLDEAGADIATEGTPGEIHVRGPSVFREYWDRPDATRDAFRDGWFRTGDVAVVEDGYYRILGRSSVDIIKTGGYKVSALEIEEVLRTHPGVRDCAVVGVEDAEWGERICAAVVPASTDPLSPEHLREWTAERLAAYKVPRRWTLLDELPRNAMGKVTKPAVKEMFG
jgi:malonyl-CoA/methylmalonyl-CoA synthetase